MEMNYLANLHRGALLGVYAIAATLVGCGGNGSAATTSASGAPSAITSGTQQPPVAPPPSSSNVTLSWTAPTENTDGSVLVNLHGYVIHYGTVANDLTSSITISNPGVTTYVVDNLAAGTYYFTLSATTTGGVQSVNSNEASITIS
jgi:Fibronectin type III domain